MAIIGLTVPNSDQETRILKQEDFDALQKLGINLMEEIQARGERTTKPLLVLFEGPITNCPKYRYRRNMVANADATMGIECIWDERSIFCPQITTIADSSRILWSAISKDGQYIIPDTGVGLMPDQLTPGIAPTPQEWLGTQPECPGPDSVVNKI